MVLEARRFVEPKSERDFVVCTFAWKTIADAVGIEHGIAPKVLFVDTLSLIRHVAISMMVRLNLSGD